jgi:hypothetical protein
MSSRFVVAEYYSENPAAGCNGCYIIKTWVFHYNDNTTEAVSVRIKKDKDDEMD